MRSAKALSGVVAVAVPVGALTSGPAPPVHQQPAATGWVKGKGYGWVWGLNDEIGALSAITSQTVRRVNMLACVTVGVGLVALLRAWAS